MLGLLHRELFLQLYSTFLSMSAFKVNYQSIKTHAPPVLYMYTYSPALSHTHTPVPPHLHIVLYTPIHMFSTHPYTCSLHTHTPVLYTPIHLFSTHPYTPVLYTPTHLFSTHSYTSLFTHLFSTHPYTPTHLHFLMHKRNCNW